MAHMVVEKKALAKANAAKQADTDSRLAMEPDVDVDLREVYFLIMHFLSAGPCKGAFGQLCDELLEHQLLPRRYHAWYSRSGARTGDKDDDGVSMPLGLLKLTERFSHIEKDHLVKLLKQLLVTCSLHDVVGGHSPNAADVPTLLGSGPFSLLGSAVDREDQQPIHVPVYLRWPHMQADQVRGLALREIGGGFTKHGRAPSIRAACYAIAKPSTMVEKMQIIKKLRGHQNAVYCATFDRSGRYVITGSDDRLVKIWSLETAFCLASCRGHEGDITDLAVSSNNILVASSSNDFNIRVWRLPDGLPISVLKGHTCTVTAIAFSPRPSAVYQLLSSSDDGTCRIWDARHSQSSPKVFIPKPPDAVDGKSNEPRPSTGQQSHRISCCAFNANGTVFVTGSSDTFARVWNACKSNAEDSEQPNYEMDLLSGHGNEVNYVQFSGCAVACKTSTADIFKEDNLPKFKNSWFAHDYIVTCSRDGSAIIWAPKSRRSHGKIGRWTQHYHLRVPPPPMPPQPPRGGPRQRLQMAPRGVNMIVWSLDNRFVLAAITDCRICVWNVSDGSLVHSLIGHNQSTFVLDVHPFNPRIAMSAGYDGKTIIWDILEGTPVKICETGPYKLVDGKFSLDGTSIILSDEVGQIFIIATGQGECQKDAKYDQFFLGDYRPLTQDTHGNVLDQETQLVPYKRNMQDLLCDSSMIPYPEPYQTMYQRRRLGNLGCEWRPPSVKFAIGPTYNANSGDFQMLPILDLEMLAEPLPEIVDAIEWEPEVEIRSDDTDSEYNMTDECSSEGEHLSLSSSRSEDPYGSADDIGFDHASKERLRRSRRKPRKQEVEITTSSGRRVKRRNLDKHEAVALRVRSTRRLKNGRSAARGKSSKSKSSRPLRRAARNARHSFSKTSEVSAHDEEDSCETSSESETELLESNSESNNESEESMDDDDGKIIIEKEASMEKFEDIAKPVSQAITGRRLVCKLPVRKPKAVLLSNETRIEAKEENVAAISLHADNGDGPDPRRGAPDCNEMTPLSGDTTDGLPVQNGDTMRQSLQLQKSHLPDLHIFCKTSSMKWGDVKSRSSKRLKLSDSTALGVSPNVATNDCNGHAVLVGDERTSSASEDMASENAPGRCKTHVEGSSSSFLRNGRAKEVESFAGSGKITEAQLSWDNKFQDSAEHNGCGGDRMKQFEASILDPENRGSLIGSGVDLNHQAGKASLPPIRRLRIASRSLAKEAGTSSSKFHSAAAEYQESTTASHLQSLASSDYEEEVDSPKSESWENTEARPSTVYTSKGKNFDTGGKMFNAVYTRSKFSRSRKALDTDAVEMGENVLIPNLQDGVRDDFDGTADDGVRRTRSMGARAAAAEFGNVRELAFGLAGTSSTGTRSSRRRGRDPISEEELKAPSRVTIRLRSTRNRRESISTSDLRPLDKRRNNPAKVSWLMLLEHEDGYRYIPQLGDEVAYLRQGHEGYVNTAALHEAVPWQIFNGSIKAVEFCRVRDLHYSSLAGSGESCCKLTLEFTDPSSCCFGETFTLTLPELLGFPDFLVERSRYEAAIERSWTRRDKPLVWWRNADEDGGSWWEGRVVNVQPRSPDFPGSPWERYEIQYKGESSDIHYHSPWELHDSENRWVHPQINDAVRKKLLAALDKLEHASDRNQDKHGIQKLKQASQKSDFLNRFPVPLSPEVVRCRLESNYYRSLEAVKHDASVMLSNAESYLGKRAEMVTKMRRLSDWVGEVFLSL